MTETILLGAAALLSTVFGIDALRNKRPFFCSILCFSSVVLLGFCAYNWQQALIRSGKDPFLLGLHSMPSVPIGMGILLAASLIFLSLGILRAVQSMRNNNTSDK